MGMEFRWRGQFKKKHVICYESHEMLQLHKRGISVKTQPIGDGWWMGNNF